MKLINLTNDPLINVYQENAIISYPQRGCLRVDSTSELVGSVGGVEVRRTIWSLVDIPPEADDNCYIVSSLTAMAIRDLYPTRKDFVCPNTHPSQVVREKGRIIGVLSFQTFSEI